MRMDSGHSGKSVSQPFNAVYTFDSNTETATRKAVDLE